MLTNATNDHLFQCLNLKIVQAMMAIMNKSQRSLYNTCNTTIRSRKENAVCSTLKTNPSQREASISAVRLAYFLFQQINPKGFHRTTLSFGIDNYVQH